MSTKSTDFRLPACSPNPLFSTILGAALLLFFTPLALWGQDCVDAQISGPFFDAAPVTGNPTVLEYELNLNIPGTTNDIAPASVAWAVNPPANATILNVTTTAAVSRVRLSITGPFTLSVSGIRTVNAEPYNCSFETNTNNLVADNPDVQPGCSINILFVLDESNSINSAEEDSVRQAVLDLLTALVGTGSSAAIVEFATFAQVYPFSGTVDYAPITTDNINGFFTTYFDTEYRNIFGNLGGTNYEAGLNAALQVLNNPNNPETTVVLFFTDGVPTFYSVPSGGDLYGGTIDGPGNINTAATATQAIAPANAVKALTHMLVIGVGDGPSDNVGNIIAISGPDKYVPGNALEADYELVTNFDDFIQDLAGIFSGLRVPAACRPDLPVNQLVNACNPGVIALKTQAQAVDQGLIFQNVTDAPCGVLVFSSNQTMTGSLCPQGITVVNTYTLTDDADGDGVDPGDLSVTCTESFLVRDVTPPTAICKNITLTINTLDGTASITAADINNGSSDNCGGNVSLSTNPATITFDCSDEGPNPVVLTVTDACGNTSQCTAIVTIECPDVADLDIDKTVNNTTPNVGDIVTFTITVTNMGPDDATGVEVTDNLPSGYTFVSATPSQGTFIGGVWTIGNLPFPGTVTLLINATVNASGNYLNLAQITDSDQIDIDSDPFSDETVDDLGDGIPDDDEDTAEVIPKLVIECPDDVMLGSCLSQSEIDQAFANWIAQFSVSGGCTPPVVTDLGQYDAPDACSGGSVVVVYTASDECGQTVSCTAIFVVAAAPTLTVNCPQSTTLGSCLDQAAVDAAFDAWLGQFSTSGGCNGTGSDLSQYSAPDACGGSVTVTYSATDDCGQFVSCSATFTVAPAPLLSVSCPPNFSTDGCGNQAEVDAAFDAWIAQFDTNGGCDPQSTDLSVYAAPSASGGSVTVTYSATDDCGQSASCSATFTVPSIPPLTENCPPDFTLGPCPSPAELNLAFNNWLAQFFTEGGLNPVSTDVSEFDPPSVCGGSVTVNYFATDDCGESASCSATFTVAPAPSITVSCPANFTFGSCQTQAQVNAAYNNWLLQFTAVGGCGALTTNIGQYTSAAPSACGGSVTVNFFASDACGQTATCSATFTVMSAPDLTVSCPQPLSLGACQSQAQVDAAFNAWKAQFQTIGGCGATSTNLNQFSAPSFCGGSVTITYTATDNCGQADICSSSFIVASAPTLTVNCPQNMSLGSCLTQAAVNAAFNNWKAQFTTSGGCGVQTTNLAQYSAPSACAGGSVTINFTATDACGQTASCSKTFTVAAAPTLTVNCPSNMSMGSCLTQSQVNTAFNNWKAQFTTSGGCGVQTTNLAQYSAPSACGGSVTINFTATDNCGQTASCSKTFTVAAAPTLSVSCPQSTTVASCQTQAAVNAAFNNWKAQFSASGGCGTTSTNLAQYSAPSACGGSVTINFTATDNCGQTASCSKTFTVAAAPTLTVNCPSNMSVGSCLTQSQVNTAFNNWKAQFTTSGGCGVTSTNLAQYSAPNACGGSVTINFTATDNCGQTASCSKTFTVVGDNVPPLVTPASNLTVQCDGNGNTAALNNWLATRGGATATDNCGGVLTWTNNYNGLSNGCGATGSATVTFTARDLCGNTASTTATFTIVDTAPPTGTCPPGVTGLTNPAQAPVIAPAVIASMYSDICGSVSAQLTSSVTTLLSPCKDFQVVQTYTITDECGNATICKITHTGRIPTQIVGGCPEIDDPLQCIDEVPAFNPAYIASFFTGGDGLPVTVMLTDTIIDAEECSFTFIYNYLVKDNCGNIKACSLVYEGEDTEAPTGTCPPVDTVYAYGQIPVPDTNYIKQFFTDNCTDITVSILPRTIEGGPCENITVYNNYLISDACGNTTVCEVPYFIPEIDPTLVGCPPEQTDLQCWKDVPTPQEAQPLVEYNFSPSATVLYLGSTVINNFCSFTIRHIYQVEDPCLDGRKICVLTFSGQDFTPPAGVCPEGLSGLECMENVPEPDPIGVALNYTDNCSEPFGYLINTIVEGDECGDFKVTYFYRIYDDCDNFVECYVTHSGGAVPGNRPEPEGDEEIAGKAGQALEMRLFPNPTSGSLTLEFEHYRKGEPASLSIYNLYGQQLLSKALVLDNSTFQLDLEGEGLASGAYYLSIRTDSEVIVRTVVLAKP